MPPIGETLRDARLRRGIDIAEVEQATKIRAKYLRALESEEFDRLPGSTFVRTFLRTYAEYLALDPQLLLEEYRNRHESPADEELQPFTPPPSSRPRSREPRRRIQAPGGLSGRAPMIAGAVAAVLLLLLVIGLLLGEDEGDAPDIPAASETGDRSREQGGRRRGGAPDARGVTLRVSPLAETYVCVLDSEGRQVFEETIAEPETFRDETLQVNLGNTQVEVELNGEEVPIEAGANPVGFEFTADGQEELPEDERPCT